MNNINLTSLPFDCLINIIKQSNDYRLLTRLPSVVKAFSQIAIAFFQNDHISRNQLYISKINNLLSNEQKIINDINLLLKKGLAFDQELIQHCEVMYGLSPELKAFLERESHNPNKKRKKLNN